MGIEVHGRKDMEEYLKSHDPEGLQKMQEQREMEESKQSSIDNNNQTNKSNKNETGNLKPEFKGKLIYAQSGTGKSRIADNVTVFDSDYILGEILGVSPQTAGFFFGRLSADQKKAFSKQYKDAIKQKIAEGYTVVTANESLLDDADVVVYNSSAEQADERINREDRAPY